MESRGLFVLIAVAAACAGSGDCVATAEEATRQAAARFTRARLDILKLKDHAFVGTACSRQSTRIVTAYCFILATSMAALEASTARINARMPHWHAKKKVRHKETINLYSKAFSSFFQLPPKDSRSKTASQRINFMLLSSRSNAACIALTASNHYYY